MKCPVCDKQVFGRSCACGWSMASLAPPTMAKRTCSWKTETRDCAMLAPADDFCQWHRWWLRTIEQGAPGRDERKEFFDWLDQFRPWGAYGHDPGQWWAEETVLWAALRGTGGNPVKTGSILRELDVRFRIAQRLLRGLGPIPRVPWSRFCGPPLPAWSEPLARRMLRARLEREGRAIPSSLRETDEVPA